MIDYDYSMILRTAIRSANIRTRNGDIFEFDDKKLSGEQLLLLTKKIIALAERKFAEQHDNSKGEKPSNTAIAGDGELLSLLRQISSNTSELLAVNTKILDLNPKAQPLEVSNNDEEDKEQSEDDGEQHEEDTAKSDTLSMSKTITYKNVLSQLPEKRHGKGSLNADKILKTVVENQDYNTIGVEVNTIKSKARMSDSSVRDSIKYLDKNLKSFKVLKRIRKGARIIYCKVEG